MGNRSTLLANPFLQNDSFAIIPLEPVRNPLQPPSFLSSSLEIKYQRALTDRAITKITSITLSHLALYNLGILWMTSIQLSS